MTVRYGEYPLPMDYEDEALDNLIDKYISEKKSNAADFTYRGICLWLFRIASNEGRLKKENDTVYDNPIMTYDDEIRISKLLWNRIWDKKIFINFSHNEYSSHYVNDTSFSIL